MKIIPQLDPALVTPEHRNNVIISVILKLNSNAVKVEDRFNKDNWIVLKKFAQEVICNEFEDSQKSEIECVYRKIPIWFFEQNGGADTSFEQICTKFYIHQQATKGTQEYKDIMDYNIHEIVFKAFELSKSVGCQHYITGCELQCFECKKIYGCRRCHDENEDHTFPKEKTDTLRCRFCGLIQPFAISCSQCKQSFGKQTCSQCRYVADFNDDSKPTYHCFECKACNVGIKEFTKHCNKCNVCVSTYKFQEHQCVKAEPCCVCMGDLASSKFSRRILQCGHQLHEFCYDKLVRSSNYKCPVCKKFMPDCDQRKSIIDYQTEIVKRQVVQEKNVITARCCDCGNSYPQIQNIFEIYYCYKCKLFNCERINEPHFSWQQYEIWKLKLQLEEQLSQLELEKKSRDNQKDDQLPDVDNQKDKPKEVQFYEPHEACPEYFTQFLRDKFKTVSDDDFQQKMLSALGTEIKDCDVELLCAIVNCWSKDLEADFAKQVERIRQLLGK